MHTKGRDEWRKHLVYLWVTELINQNKYVYLILMHTKGRDEWRKHLSIYEQQNN